MYRKSLFLLLFSFSIVFAVIAQDFHMGVKFGTDIQKVDGLKFSQKFAFGYHVGGFAELKISKTITFQPELYYSSVELELADDFSATYQTIDLSKIKFGYLNIPLLLNINPTKKISIQFGPRYGIIVDDNLTLKDNASNAFKTGDFSMLSGIQLNLSKIRIYGRYQIGLSDLNDITGSTEKWTSQTIHLGVGLRIL